jgi:hypothetical protein
MKNAELFDVSVRQLVALRHSAPDNDSAIGETFNRIKELCDATDDEIWAKIRELNKSMSFKDNEKTSVGADILSSIKETLGLDAIIEKKRERIAINRARKFGREARKEIAKISRQK